MTVRAVVGHGATAGHGGVVFGRLSPSELAALRERIAALPLDQAGEVLDAAAARLKAAAVVAPPSGSASAGPTLVDAKAVAQALGVTPAWVWDHADELGAIRLGDGPRPRLRFDLERARAAFADRRAAGSAGRRSVAADPAPPQALRRRGPARTPSGASLLPVRGQEEAHRDAA